MTSRRQRYMNERPARSLSFLSCNCQIPSFHPSIHPFTWFSFEFFFFFFSCVVIQFIRFFFFLSKTADIYFIFLSYALIILATFPHPRLSFLIMSLYVQYIALHAHSCLANYQSINQSIIHSFIHVLNLINSTFPPGGRGGFPSIFSQPTRANYVSTPLPTD